MASRIAEILIRAKLIDELQLRSALAHQQQWGGRLSHIVVEKRFAREDLVLEAIASAMKLPKVDLSQVEKDAAALAKIDADFARANAVFPCALRDGGKTLWLAMADPCDVPIVDEVSYRGRVRIKIVVASENQIQTAIKRCYFGETVSDGSPARLGAVEIESSDPNEVGFSGGSSEAFPMRVLDPSTPPDAEPIPLLAKITADVKGQLLGAWSAEDLVRLRSIYEHQEGSARIVNALVGLCIERGVFKTEEYEARLKKRSS